LEQCNILLSFNQESSLRLHAFYLYEQNAVNGSKTGATLPYLYAVNGSKRNGIQKNAQGQKAPLKTVYGSPNCRFCCSSAHYLQLLLLFEQ
jgi:hypothetical protein